MPVNNLSKTIGILAGEASGDLLGAALIKALHQKGSHYQFTGIGGPAMLLEGCHSLFEMENLSVMGLVEPLFRLPTLFRIRRSLYQYFKENPPAIFIGIDSPDFNLGLELKLRRAGIRVVHYVSPSVWAWRQKRINKIAKATDLVLTLFPFETAFYQKHHVPVQFVGHPLADMIPLQNDSQASRIKLGLEVDTKYIAILPGSRDNEIKYLSDIFLKTAKLCWQKDPSIKFITSTIHEKHHDAFKQAYQRICPDLPLIFFQKKSHEVMSAADCVLVTSGTATLEAMLFKRPMVIAYRMAYLTYQLARHLVKLKFIGLPNLLADEMLVPEFIQANVTPENLSTALLDFLDHPQKVAALQEKFLSIHETLRRSASEQAAQAIMQLL